MNVLIERYDRTLKHTMALLGKSEGVARTRLGVIERMRAENKKDKEILREKFEKLEAALKTDRAAKKILMRENKSLETANAALEKEKAELQAERDAVTRKLINERKRLRDSREQEVSRERVRVEAAMKDKFNRCLGRVRAYLEQRAIADKEQSLCDQAAGTRKCLEMIKEEKLGITQDLIDVFAGEEKEHEAKVVELGVGPLPEEAFALSPLNLPSRFVNEEFMAALDPYGSNDDLVSSETASGLRSPRDILGGDSTGQSKEKTGDATVEENDGVAEEVGQAEEQEKMLEEGEVEELDDPTEADPSAA